MVDSGEVAIATETSGVRHEARHYPEYRAIEWQVRLRHSASEGAPLYENLKSADFVVRFPTTGPLTLHWNKGSRAESSDFEPRVESLMGGRLFALESFGGRSSEGAMPYFNLAGHGGGLIVAVGWTGDWRASFEALGDGRVRVMAGLKRSRFRLRAGEEVRLPSILAMSYRGEWLDGQNQFRRLMLQHFTPTSQPPLQLMPVAASVHGMIGFNDTTETNLTALAHDIAALKLPLDTFWLDAGWNTGGFPLGQGNPEPDVNRFPRGLAPVGDAVRKTGMRFLAWFEPERVMRGTWLEREQAPWLLKPSATPEALRYQERDGFCLLDLSNAEAHARALETVSKEIREAGIAIYRQDFNLYPSFFWHTGEAPDEVGLREVRYVNGLYAFLDELVRRHPGLILDNCASGGRRLDFEMMRRCVALWRSDSCWGAKTFPRNVQAMTQGLSLWLPLHGLGAAMTDDVALRSGMGACASFAINFRDPPSVAALRRHLDRYLKARPLFTKDFYPLTPWSEDPTRLLAFQFNDPETGAGIVQVFGCATTNHNPGPLRLRGLERGGTYKVTDWDAAGKHFVLTGAELLERGLPLSATRGSNALVFEYGRIASAASIESSRAPSRIPVEFDDADRPDDRPHRTGRVGLNDHALVDDQGAFLRLGVSYFTALGRYRHDRPRLERDLAFLAQQGFRYTRVLSMVGWFPAWKGLEIAPLNFTNRAGHTVATWHFSRDRAADDGWRPVIDCRRLAQVPGCPTVSSNEPIGPGEWVVAETSVRATGML